MRHRKFGSNSLFDQGLSKGLVLLGVVTTERQELLSGLPFGGFLPLDEDRVEVSTLDSRYGPELPAKFVHQGKDIDLVVDATES
jgi:hypothetical protein